MKGKKYQVEKDLERAIRVGKTFLFDKELKEDDIFQFLDPQEYQLERIDQMVKHFENYRRKKKNDQMQDIVLEKQIQLENQKIQLLEKQGKVEESQFQTKLRPKIKLNIPLELTDQQLTQQQKQQIKKLMTQTVKHQKDDETHFVFSDVINKMKIKTPTNIQNRKRKEDYELKEMDSVADIIKKTDLLLRKKHMLAINMKQQIWEDDFGIGHKIERTGLKRFFYKNDENIFNIFELDQLAKCKEKDNNSLSYEEELIQSKLKKLKRTKYFVDRKLHSCNQSQQNNLNQFGNEFKNFQNSFNKKLSISKHKKIDVIDKVKKSQAWKNTKINITKKIEEMKPSNQLFILLKICQEMYNLNIFSPKINEIRMKSFQILMKQKQQNLLVKQTKENYAGIQQDKSIMSKTFNLNTQSLFKSVNSLEKLKQINTPSSQSDFNQSKIKLLNANKIANTLIQLQPVIQKEIENRREKDDKSLSLLKIQLTPRKSPNYSSKFDSPKEGYREQLNQKKTFISNDIKSPKSFGKTLKETIVKAIEEKDLFAKDKVKYDLQHYMDIKNKMKMQTVMQEKHHEVSIAQVLEEKINNNNKQFQ